MTEAEKKRRNLEEQHRRAGVYGGTHYDSPGGSRSGMAKRGLGVLTPDVHSSASADDWKDRLLALFVRAAERNGGGGGEPNFADELHGLQAFGLVGNKGQQGGGPGAAGGGGLAGVPQYSFNPAPYDQASQAAQAAHGQAEQAIQGVYARLADTLQQSAADMAAQAQQSASGIQQAFSQQGAAQRAVQTAANDDLQTQAGGQVASGIAQEVGQQQTAEQQNLQAAAADQRALQQNLARIDQQSNDQRQQDAQLAEASGLNTAQQTLQSLLSQIGLAKAQGQAEVDQANQGLMVDLAAQQQGQLEQDFAQQEEFQLQQNQAIGEISSVITESAPTLDAALDALGRQRAALESGQNPYGIPIDTKALERIIRAQYRGREGGTSLGGIPGGSLVSIDGGLPKRISGPYGGPNYQPV